MNEDVKAWGATLGQSFGEFGGAVAAFLPRLFGAVLLLVLGWVLARLLRALTVRGGVALERLVLRLLPLGSARAQSVHASAEVLGGVVYWAVILLVVAAASQVLGLEVVGQWLERVVRYLPTLLAGVLIVVAGALVSAMVRDLVVATAPVPGSQRQVFGMAAQGTIMASAIVIGADQIGIDVTFLIMLAGIALAALLGGLALAVSLGARPYVSDLIGARQLQQNFEIGQYLHIGSHQGRVLELTATGLLLETPEGRLYLPARRVLEEAVLVVDPARDGDA